MSQQETPVENPFTGLTAESLKKSVESRSRGIMSDDDYLALWAGGWTDPYPDSEQIRKQRKHNTRDDPYPDPEEIRKRQKSNVQEE